MADTKARQRAKRIVQERGLAALANDTKWREFFDQMQAQRIPLEVKILYEEAPFQVGCVWSPSENYIEGSGGMGPELFVFVEWVRSQALKEMQAAAAAIGLECEVREGKATVYGYR
jgi:hypothetical protein